MYSADHFGDDLSAATLHTYLQDPTFVEYFNSFLLLPAFSSRVFYNADTGLFEQVHTEGMLGWGVTPSSSQATLYLADEAIGPSLDQQQSKLWVIQHRLPLFLRSDLYSEYKLCKLLITPKSEVFPVTTSTITHAPPPPPKGHSSLQEELAVTLPSLPLPPPSQGNCIPRRNSLSSLSYSGSAQACTTNHHQTGRQQSSASSTPITVSRSDIELGDRTKSVTPSDSHKSSLKRSLSVELSSKVLTFLEAPSSAEGERLPLHLVSKVLGTKSGMSAFWKFLRGKAGERNWLFWLDAERVKYYQKPINQQRVLRELRERYLHAGAPLELPAEARSKLHVSKSSRLTLQQLGELQQALVQGLRDYWSPRFILHRHHNTPLHPHPSTSSTTAIPFFRSFSTTPVALHTITPPHPHSTTSPKHPKLPSPFTPTQTPTFRKLTSVRPRSKSSPTNYQIQEEHPSDRKDGNHHPIQPTKPQTGDNRTSNLPSIAMPFHCEATSTVSQRPHTVDTASIRPPVRGKSRKVWHKQSPQKEGQSQSPLAHFSQLAKYTQHHLPDVNSRCASVLGSKSASSMCGSRCQIFSVSGTPLHTDPPTPTPQGDTYTPLLYCLATEQRKAGGYFQQHLERLEDMTFLHCLLFWRDVQEYKGLFTADSFIPCAVERKAKMLYSCYIMEDSSEDICCPPSVVDTITSHLWPAYEDLFDRAEEHALRLLLEKWLELCSSEDSTFRKLDVVSRYSSPHTNRRGHTSDIVGLEDLDEEELYLYEEDVTVDMLDFTSRSPSPAKHLSRPPSRMSTLRPLTSTPHTLTRSPSPLFGSVSQVSEQSRAISLNDIMDNPTELEHFKVYLNENYAAQDLMCWMEIESFRGIPASDKHVRDLKARQLRSKYFNKKYLFGPNSPASKEAQRQVVAAGGGGYGGRLPARPRTPVFREAQKHVRARLEKKWLAGFMSTPGFIERNGGSTLSVEKRGGSQSATPSKSFMYEKSFANSHEAILLRRVLQDEGGREPFQRYLCIKASPGTHPREDIQFWLEVQKYKDMCHAHTTEEMLHQKVSAIVDCYFQSSVPPPLQLDIQPSLADQVVKKQPGPYIFREAQAAVFKHLYYHWQDYQNFTSGYNEEEIDSAISKFGTQMRQLQATTRDANFQSKQEEERKKLSVPRFETAAEREERVKKEVELTRFGEVAIAFRLSTPDTSNYTYYTEVPGECREESILRQWQGVDTKKINKSDDHSANNRYQCAVDSQSFDTFSYQTRQTAMRKSFPWDNIKPGPCVGRSMKSGYINRRSTDEREEAKNVGTDSHVQPTTVTAMRLARGRGGRRQRYSPPSATLQSDKLSDPSAAESTQEHFHSSRPVSSRTGASKNNSTFRGKNRKKCPIVSNSKFLPHCTISMQISGTRGSPFSYGAGLPDDQQSHLSILSIT